MTYKKGDKFDIHCYKHNGRLHKVWDEALYIGEDKEYIVFANENALVTTDEGKNWRTKEPAIMLFSKKNWFNIIGQIKQDGIYYYCNLASPYIIENKTIKYIDYDLDLRVFNDGSFKVLDRGEYRYHKRIMHYSKEIDSILKNELTELINIVRKKEYPFDRESIKKYYQIYIKVKEDEKVC